MAPDDADFIQAAVATDRSDFGLTDLPAEISFISGVFIHSRMSKIDAGPADMQVSMMSNALRGAGVNRPVTTLPTYYSDVIEVDPNTGARWTRVALNAAHLRFDRNV